MQMLLERTNIRCMCWKAGNDSVQVASLRGKGQDGPARERPLMIMQPWHAFAHMQLLAMLMVLALRYGSPWCDT